MEDKTSLAYLKDKLNINEIKEGDVEITDNLILNSTAKTESIIPQSDDNYNLGSADKGWDNAYIHKLFGSSILTVGDGETSHILNNKDDLLVSGNQEVNGNSYFDGDVSFGGTINGVISSGELGFLNGVTSEIQTQFSDLNINIDALDTAKQDALSSADTDTSGYLTYADWNTFNSKQNAITPGTSLQYYTGDKTWATLNQAAVDGLKITNSPTFAGLTLGASGLNMSNYPVTNIGSVNTDFTGTGGLTLADALTVSGGGMDVTGSATFNSGATIVGNLGITGGNMTLVGDLDVTGDTTTTGNVDVGGDLTIDGEPFDRIKLIPLLNQTIGTTAPAANNISIDTTYSPQSVVFDGRYIWVNSATSNNLTKIDPQTNPPSILTVIPNIGPYTWNPEFDGTSIWVSAPTDTNQTSILWKVNTTTNAVSGPFTVGLAPRGKAFDGTYMWIANWGDGSISKVNVATNAVTTPITGLTGVYDLAFDGTYMWAVSTSANTVTKINYLTNTIIATFPVGNYPSKVAFDGTHIWVSSRDDGTVQVVNRNTGGIEATISVGTRPRWLAFDGKYMWVVCRDSSNIYTIDVKTRSIHSIINIGNGSTGLGTFPFGAAFDGESMWVINNGGTAGDGLPDVVRYSTDEGFLSHSLGEFALTVSSPGTNNDFDTGNEVCQQLAKTCVDVYHFSSGLYVTTEDCTTADPNGGAKFYTECK